MKFAIYVVNLDDGEIAGYNDVDQVEQFIENDQYMILMPQHGVYFLGSRVQKQVEAGATGDDFEEEDDDNDAS
jgi:hypothetical protein